MKLCVLLVAALVSLPAWAEEFLPFAGPRPLAVFIQSEPWARVRGADLPRFILYEDQTVIYARQHDEGFRYHTAKLDAKPFMELRAKFSQYAKRFPRSATYDVAPNSTDQPRALFCFRSGDRYTTTTVYGLQAAGTKPAAHSQFDAERNPKVPPRQLLELHKLCSSYQAPHARPWQPRYVEVMLWPYEHAVEKSIIWPANWPSLRSDRAMRRGEDYSLFLDATQLPVLQKFLASQMEKGAIEVDRRKWSATWRYVFPSEPVWRAAFQEDWKKAAE